MKKLLASLTLALGLTTGLATEVMAQNVWYQSGIWGEEKGSRVNCRPQPSMSSSDGSYVLVGQSVKARNNEVNGFVLIEINGYRCWVNQAFTGGQEDPYNHPGWARVGDVRYSVPQSSGICNVPSDRDRLGRRCGGRAASVRPRGR